MGRPRAFDEQLVLERAMDEFWTHGYAATSPAQLAAATGLAKGSLYNAFSSKRELFERCIEVYHERTRELALGILEGPGTARESIAAAFRAVVDSDREDPRGCLVGNTAVELGGQDEAIARRIRRIQGETTEWIAERISRGQREGDVALDVDPRAYAEHLATTLAGLRVMAVTHDAAVLHRVIDTALSGI